MASNRPSAWPAITTNVAVQAPDPVSGTAGVWSNITPAGISLAAGYSQTVSGNTDDNFGVQDVRAHPSMSGLFYAFVCYQGCWRTSNYGQTWIKVSGTSVLDTGKNWSSAISKDGDYLLNCSGNNFSTAGNNSAQTNQTVQRSTDSGVTWIKTADLGFEIYCVRCSPYDNLRCIANSKAQPSHFYESTDGGVTWTDHGDFSANLNSAYCHYVHNSDTAIFIGQDGGAALRMTKSGGTWSSATITDLATVGHYHGLQECVYDAAQTAFWLPSSGGAGGTEGIWKSSNNATNFTRVYSATAESVMVRTQGTLYAMFGVPINGGTQDSKFTTAAVNPGTSFGTATDPNALYGMANGAKGIGVGFDGVRTCLIAGAWCAGIWRYIEP